jgi:hypothetical protein
MGPSAGDLVIVSRALADLAEFLQLRQESAGRGRVLMDRRMGERRHTAHAVEQDRRQRDRRRSPSDPTQALMRVLGFMVVPSAVPPARSASHRRAKRPPRASRPAVGPRRATPARRAPRDRP